MQFKTVPCLVAAAVACAIAFVMISNATVIPLVAKGSGPDGVQVTSSGWFALLLSALGAGGFTVAGVVAAIIPMIAKALGVSTDRDSADELATEIVELTTSFAALMKERSNRAAQRRFFFALVDVTSLIHGCTATHENGVVIIKYTGYTEQPEGIQP